MAISIIRDKSISYLNGIGLALYVNEATATQRTAGKRR
jgi:hypothetical protein